MSKSYDLFLRAKETIPGGVNSPVRAFQAVGGTPPFFEKGEGAFLTDVDGKRYIDYVGSWGPLVLGHCDKDVVQAVKLAAEKGLTFGAPTPIEIDLAEKVVELIPSAEKVRMVNSGTEATMTAIRLSRGFTGRKKIIKFQGCYHGHSDGLLVKAGSGALTLGTPSSPGVPEEITSLTLNLEYNNSEQVYEAFAQYGEDIACVIVEPIAGNMGCVLPKKDFLRTLRQCCTNHGALLIFDEVITGFRVALGGAQTYYDIKPDLTTFGKIIGGGMPVGALCGKANIMDYLSPVGSVYQAGTLAGNPLAMTAGLITLQKCQQSGFYERLFDTTQKLAQGFKALADEKRIPMVVNWAPGMLSLFFTEKDKVETFEDVMASDVERFKLFYHAMLEEGIYLGPSAFESMMVSICHDDDLIDITLNKASKIFAKLA